MKGATWMHCSNPPSVKMAPSRERREDPVEPNGANPPPALKFEDWNDTAISATIVPLVRHVRPSLSRLEPVNVGRMQIVKQSGCR